MSNKKELSSLDSFDGRFCDISTSHRMENKRFSLSIRPTDSKQSLYESLRQKFTKLSSLPIEYFENELYSLCYQHSQSISNLDLKTLSNFHAVIELKRKENKLSTESFSVLNQALKREVALNANIFLHYSILKETIDLLTGLVIKWRISNLYNILYRFQNIIVTLPMIDLKDIKLNYFSMQTIALTYYVQEPPLSNLVSFECKCYAKLAQDACSHIINIILKTNDRFHMTLPSISGVIVHEKPKLREFFRTMPSSVSQEYQTLKFPHPVKKFFRVSELDPQVKVIYEALKSFDMAYRKFEASLFEILINLNEIKLGSS